MTLIVTTVSSLRLYWTDPHARSGVAIGIVSAFCGGKIDLAIKSVVNILLSFPIIVPAAVVVAMLGTNPNVVIAIAMPIMPKAVRVTPVAERSVREMLRVNAARQNGYSNMRIRFTNIVTNVIVPHLLVLTRFYRAGNPLGVSLCDRLDPKFKA